MKKNDLTLDILIGKLGLTVKYLLKENRVE